jgi:hypothetical protein
MKSFLSSPATLVLRCVASIRAKQSAGQSCRRNNLGRTATAKLAFTVTGLALLSGDLDAANNQILRGLFCNTRAQLEQTLAHVESGGNIAFAVAMTNIEEVVCTFATEVHFLVRHPADIGSLWHNGRQLRVYDATLIGVLVGGNPRPIEPPLKTFFVPIDPVPEGDAESGA